jgi:hypothetical protein
MAVLLLLLAIIGGVVVGDLVWENTEPGDVTVFDRTFTGYPQGWLLAMAAALGFLVALLLLASLGSTRARRARRRQLRAIKRDQREATVREPEHASWLDESFGRHETVESGRPAEERYGPR